MSKRAVFEAPGMECEEFEADCSENPGIMLFLEVFRILRFWPFIRIIKPETKGRRNLS